MSHQTSSAHLVGMEVCRDLFSEICRFVPSNRCRLLGLKTGCVVCLVRFRNAQCVYNMYSYDRLTALPILTFSIIA